MGMGGRGGLGIGTIVVLGIIGYALGIDPRLLIGGAEMFSGGGSQQQQAPSSPRARPARRATRWASSSSRVLGSTEVQWKQIFEQAGQRYRAPTLVMFAGQTRADACGQAQSAMGPFYCPADQKIYLDTSFFRDLERRFKGCDAGSKSCQFAQAYVIAHEVGHHVQNQLGILPKVQQQQRGLSKTEANRMQVQGRAAGRLLRRRLGATSPTSSGSSSSRATSRPRCRPRRRSATTGCRSRRRATSSRTRSRTARRSSASAGSTSG